MGDLLPSSKLFSTLRSRWIGSLLWLALVSAAAFFWRLGTTGLVDETEPLFAEAARQMGRMEREMADLEREIDEVSEGTLGDSMPPGSSLSEEEEALLYD